jgi:hypothetical protein
LHEIGCKSALLLPLLLLLLVVVVVLLLKLNRLRLAYKGLEIDGHCRRRCADQRQWQAAGLRAKLPRRLLRCEQM